MPATPGLLPPATISASPDAPRLLVEPFDDLSEAANSATIAQGLTEEVIAHLSKFRELVVIVGRGSAGAPLAEVGVAPMARFVLRGSLRLEQGKVRLSVRLVNREDSAVLWAESYDGDLSVSQLLEVENDIARRVAATIGQPYGIVFRADADRALKGPPEDWDAYACTLAFYAYRSELDRATHASVRACLERTVARFPDYATAWALLSLVYLDGWRFHYQAEGPSSLLDLAAEASRRALELDPTNVRGLQAKMTGLFFRNDAATALEVGEQALALNPNDIEVMRDYGMRLALTGEWARGCPLVEDAVERNAGPFGLYHSGLALCSYMQGDYETAAVWIRKADIHGNPIYHFIAAAIYGQLGDAEAGARERDWIVDNAPTLLRDLRAELATRIKAEGDQQHILDGLRKAGVPLPPSS